MVATGAVKTACRRSRRRRAAQPARWRRSHRAAARSPSRRLTTSASSAGSLSIDPQSPASTKSRRSQRISGLVRPQEIREAAPQPGVLLALLLERRQSLAGQLEIAPRAAGLGLVEPRRDEPLLLEAAQGDEHGRLRDGAAGPLLQ